MSLLLTCYLLYSLLDCLRCPRSPCRYTPRRGMEGPRIHTRRCCRLLRHLRHCPRLCQRPTSHHDQGVPGGLQRVPSRMFSPSLPQTTHSPLQPKREPSLTSHPPTGPELRPHQRSLLRGLQGPRNGPVPTRKEVNHISARLRRIIDSCTVQPLQTQFSAQRPLIPFAAQLHFVPADIFFFC